MTGDETAAAGMDAVRSVQERTCAAEPSPVASNPLRARMERELARLEQLRQPSLEQIERKLFLKDYLALRF